jgi:DNA-directed RNA polymerases I, II, and III subunit RPABC1
MGQENIQSSQIIEIYKSRKTIINLLKLQGYDVTQYENFSINEVNSLIETKQMDMLMFNNTTGKKVYVKYHLSSSSIGLAKSMRPTNIHEYIEDLYAIDEILKPSDDLIIIMKDEPNDTIRKTLLDIWEQNNIYVNIINIKRLQYNIMEHQLVPKHIVLTDEEKEEVKLKYNIMSDKDIPDISRFSPVSQVIGIRPGNFCKIIRPSKTSIKSDFYRVCLNK